MTLITRSPYAARQGLDANPSPLRRLVYGPKLLDAAAGQHNNFTLIRLALALAVVVSHGFSVTTGQVEAEPLATSTGFTLGEHAVNGFFVLSGFLVTMSFDRRGWRDYALARVLRIAPGLIAATLLVALVMGGLMTTMTLGAYLSDGNTWSFISRTLTTFKSNLALPGVFPDNPFRFPMGTVWTLKYEVICYLGVFVLGIAGLLRNRAFAIVLVVALAIAVAVLDYTSPGAPKGQQTALRLLLLFAAGGLMYRVGDRLRLSLAVLLAGVVATVLLRDSFLYQTLLFLTQAYGVLWLALVPVSAHVPDPAWDVSYGTYLYGWPVQQTLFALLPAWGAWALLGPSIVLTLIVGALSWLLVEKPAMRLKSRLMKRRR